MAKKRVTLPKDFDELLKVGDIEALKAVYDKCELTAYDGKFGLHTALHYKGVPDELVIWLVKQGLDVNIPDYYGCTPLYSQATFGMDTVKLLYELGGDIQKSNRYGNTPLHMAAEYFRPNTVRFLIEKGADVNAKNERGETPLLAALTVCGGLRAVPLVEIAEMLIKAGVEITPEMAEKVEIIGKDFEFHRDNFSEASCEEVDTALSKLYNIFGAKPVAKRIIHDGVSPILVKGSTWKEQYNELWDLLIPSTGAAKTVQGEVIRITGRVDDEINRNGGINWDRSYRNMLNSLPIHFAEGNALSEKEIEESKVLISKIDGKGLAEDGVITRLCELAVSWVILNPNPIPLGEINYNR